MIKELDGKLVVIMDIKTSGQDPEQHEIVDFAAIFVKQMPNGAGMRLLLGVFAGPVKPRHIKTSDTNWLKSTGYREELWNDSAYPLNNFIHLFTDKLNMLMLHEKLDGVVLVGDNIDFIARFFRKALLEANREGNFDFQTLDIKEIASRYGFMTRDLTSLCLMFNVVVNTKPPYYATDDAETMFSVLQKLAAMQA